jgi:hypothetical protein
VEADAKHQEDDADLSELGRERLVRNIVRVTGPIRTPATR